MTNVVTLDVKDRKEIARERLDAFCEALCDGKNRTQAYLAAGFTIDPKYAPKEASNYYKTHHEYVKGYMHERIGHTAPLAFKVLVDVMTNEKEKGGIRIKAAQDVLDRAGYMANQKIELTTKDVRELSTGDLQSEINRILSESPELAKVFALKRD